MRARILHISRYEDDGRRLAQTLHTLRLVVDHVSTLRQAGPQLQQEEYDVVLTEAVVQDGNWLDVLHLARQSARELRVVITDSHADARFRARALDMGAYDLLTQTSCEPRGTGEGSPAPDECTSSALRNTGWYPTPILGAASCSPLDFG